MYIAKPEMITVNFTLSADELINNSVFKCNYDPYCTYNVDLVVNTFNYANPKILEMLNWVGMIFVNDMINVAIEHYPQKSMYAKNFKFEDNSIGYYDTYVIIQGKKNLFNIVVIKLNVTQFV